MNQITHEKMHWSCCLKPVLGKILWWGAFLAFVGGFLAYLKGGKFLGITIPTWYWNALVGGVLAVGLKAKHHSCASCEPKP